LRRSRAEALDVDEIVCSPLNVGGGTVKCAHGTLPVPAPATLELLKNAPVYSSGIQSELVTPTGAAIVKTLARRFASFPRMNVEKIGYGAGTRDFDGHANVVRLTIGETQAQDSSDTSQDTITVLEANIDDLNHSFWLCHGSVARRGSARYIWHAGADEKKSSRHGANGSVPK